MIAEKVLQHPCNVLTEAQRLQFFRDGFLVVENYVPEPWLERLRAATRDLVERSRAVRESDATFILEEGHSAESPRLHRVSSPQDHHEEMWAFMRDPVMTDLVADVVGPDVKFHHAKLNVKSGKGSGGFDWHQDIPAWPHTDYSPVTVGVYINGCRPDQGPLSFLPGSHNGPLYSMYDDEGNFVVRIREADLAWVTEDMVARPTGGPGTTVLLNCRTVHGSSPNRSADPRLLLLPVYSSADSFPYTANPIPSVHQGDVVRGQPARHASFDTRSCELPPDWRFGYKTVWQHKKKPAGY
ncbi:phytanoyl-CoA dioxygenase family protein [Pulveribacter sp.]|uniref:phytanoyl-CoA dioxygenase family protein n=1 Tax=Pulveribacter sp. TaxID=2678893 RepID=UPI0028A8A31A|nr:phytanoyl-CoA dioxygenase family protein [Pulveribacter sp.]